MKTIVITGIGDTRNNGCWAMAASAMTSIRQASPVPVKFIIFNRKNAIDTERLAFEDVECVSCPWTLVTIPRTRLLWILFCAMLLVLQACLCRIFPQKLIFRGYWRAMRQADLVLDLSGDSISSDYNWVANLTVILPLLIARLVGKPYYLCAQSIGPFGKDRIGRLTIAILRAANLITVREDLTKEILTAHGMVKNVRRTQDLAFLLTPSDDDERQRLLDQQGIDQARNWVGISVSSIIASYAFRDLPSEARDEAYMTSLASFCDEIYERYGYSTLFVPHVVTPGKSDDRRVTKLVQERMRQKECSRVIDGDYTGAQLKSLIGLCRFFIGSRMHATIAALSQGIPTITLVYNHKTLGINGDVLGQHDYLIDIRSIGSDTFGYALSDCFARLVANADNVRETLLSILPAIREGARENSWFAVDFLNVAGPLERMSQPCYCTGCGTCVGVCPVHALVMRETSQGTLRPVLRRKCTGCRRCDQVCPALGFDLAAAQVTQFNSAAEGDDLGNCVSCRTGYATDQHVRFNGASGGLVTAVAAHLLTSNRVDAVLTVAADPEDPFVQRARWATKSDELLAAQGSRYLPASVNEAFAEIPAGAQRLAVVGLPCHLWGVHLLEKSGILAKRSIEWRLGLFCGRTPSLHAADALLASLGFTRQEIKRLTFRGEGWPGTSRIGTATKNIGMSLAEMWGFIGSPFFIRAHCFTCPDFFSSLSDLSFGDAWLPECRGDKVGSNLVLARTERGTVLLDEMTREGRIEMREVSSQQVKMTFSGNILSKQRYGAIKTKIIGEAPPVVCGAPQNGSIRVWLSYRYEWLLAQVGMSPTLCRALLRFPPTRTMRGLRRILAFLHKGR